MSKKKVKARLSAEQELHHKSWGYEHWIENCPEYCGKRLVFEPGGATSMHFHIKKLETMYLLRGLMVIEFVHPETAEKYEIRLSPGDSVQIPRGQLHRILALEESELLEFSTMHEDSDSYRAWR